MTGALAGVGILRPGRLDCRWRWRIRASDAITPPASIPAANTSIGGTSSCCVMGGGSAAARPAGGLYPAGSAEPPGDPAGLAAACGWRLAAGSWLVAGCEWRPAPGSWLAAGCEWWLAAGSWLVAEWRPALGSWLAAGCEWWLAAGCGWLK
jgi:hypothetical protein